MNKSIIKTYEKEQNMINAKITDIPVPVTRTEHFMYSAITGNESGLKADTQAEVYLDAIKNSDTSDLEGLEPRTVLDMYLEARQTGNLDDLPKPRTTSEMLLYQAITGEDLGAKPVSNMDKYLSLLEPNNYDARLEIESEESVIHLTDSKNGVVEVKELEGNTLVNYVQDGTKELTLNGDIDVAGTNVTLTDTVDNGLVNVVCEGNTLVNLLNLENYTLPNSSAPKDFKILALKPSTTYTLKINCEKNQAGSVNVKSYPSLSNLTNIGEVDNLNSKIVFTTLSEGDFTDCRFRFYTNNGNLKIYNVLLLEGDYTNKPIPSYFEGMRSVGECEDNKIEILSRNSDNTLSSKKEIQLSEPLRALPNGVKDKVMKVGGKWYVERNCGEVTFDGDESFSIETSLSYSRFISKDIINAKSFSKRTECLFDKFVFSEGNENKTGFTYMKKMFFYVNEFSTVDEFKAWLQTNPTTIVYELETPIYEPLEIDPTINTYTDITHISNNSTIPCNMQVKNTGYNVIIKPSTQYTIAFDADKAEEVGINLAGSKVTTTNNVATITTPSTLTDDSLRLTGKGIKVSKVRLLEGDKTNWIPSYFEGMKSSFEDKLQDDGTFKMEILSNNANLFNIDKVYSGFRTKDNFTIQGTTTAYNTSIFSRTVGINTVQDVNNLIFLKRGSYNFKMNTDQHICISIHNSNGVRIGDYYIYRIGQENLNLYFDFDCFIDIKIEQTKVDFTVSNIMISRSNDDYIEYKSNKIQFSSIEPLRGVGDVKDRFVFKDNKLMIERNIKEIVVDNNMNWTSFDSNTTPNNPRSYFLLNDCSDFQERNRYGICKDFALHHSDLDIKHFKMHSYSIDNSKTVVWFYIPKISMNTVDSNGFKEYFKQNPTKLAYPINQPTYEEVPYETQKIILEGYENGTLFFDTNIPPKSLISYTANTSNIYRYLDTLKLSKAERDSIINSMERV